MVRDEYRNVALGGRLMVEAQNDTPFALSLGQTAEMRQINFRLGWKQVAPLQTAQFLIRPERVLRGKLPTSVAWAAGLGLRASTAVLDLVMRGRRGADVRQVARFGPEHDCVWQQMARTVECAVVRDASYLNWKYVDQPGQQFLRLEVRQGGAAKAIAVCMVREPDEFYKYSRAFLLDLVAPTRDDGLVMDAIQAAGLAAADAGADSISCLHVGAWLTQRLKRSGYFLRSPERFLLIQPGDLTETERDSVLTGDNWYVTQGDSDLDRP